MPIIFSTKPALIIFGILKRPEPKTIAFGGVATGNINAQLAAKVTGAAKMIGLIPISIAIAPIIGKNVAVVAILLVNSVMKMIIIAIITTRTVIGRVSIADKFDPIHAAKPVLLTADANDSPPPKSSKILHGKLFK